MGGGGTGYVKFGIDTFPNEIGDRRFHLLRFGFGLMQACQTLLPFFKFGITEHSVLNDLIALIFAAKGGGGRFGLRGTNEGAKFGMQERGLGANVEKGRRGALEAQGKSVRPSEACAGCHLRDVVVPQFTGGGGSVLLVSGGEGLRLLLLLTHCH